MDRLLAVFPSSAQSSPSPSSISSPTDSSSTDASSAFTCHVINVQRAPSHRDQTWRRKSPSNLLDATSFRLFNATGNESAGSESARTFYSNDANKSETKINTNLENNRASRISGASPSTSESSSPSLHSSTSVSNASSNSSRRSNHIASQSVMPNNSSAKRANSRCATLFSSSAKPFSSSHLLSLLPLFLVFLLLLLPSPTSGCMELLNGWQPLSIQERAILAKIVVSAKCVRTFEDEKTPKGSYSAEFSVFNVLKV